MANCLSQIHACAIRVTRLLATGVPDPGADNLYVSDALVSLTTSPEIEAGDEFIVKNACGSPCVNYKDCDRYKRWNLELEICTPDPELHELLAGGVVLEDGEAQGYGVPFLGAGDCPNGFSIELWAKRIDSSGAQDADFPWAWWVLPRAYLVLGERKFENGPLNNPFTGYAIENPNWFDGPTNDFPVESDRAIQWIPTDTIPEPTCGYQALAAS